MVCRVIAWSLVMGGWEIGVVSAQVPSFIRYQGQAVDSQGVPLEGPYTLTFRLYDAATGGTKIWEEIQANVALQDGRFSVLLGQVTPLAAMDWGEPCWLSVQVGSEPELAPRQRITSVPLALTTERLADSQDISPVNLFKDGSFESWNLHPYPTLRDWRVSSTVSAWDVVKRETSVVRFGQASAKLVYDGWGHYGNVNQELTDWAHLRGQPVTLAVWASAMQPRQVYLEIGDGVTTSEARAHSGNGTWEYLTLTHVLSPQATHVTVAIAEVSIAQLGGVDPYPPVYIDGASLVAGPMPFAFSPHPSDGMGPITADGDRVGIGVLESNPTHILTIQQGSLTDPIADSWTVYPSDRQHKELLRPVNPHGYLDQIKAVPLYEWKRAPIVSDQEAEQALGKDRPANVELEAMRNDLAIAKSKLPKFSTKRVGMVIDDAGVPQEVLTFNADGTTAGIDVLAYLGYLHAALKEAAVRISNVEVQVKARKQDTR